MIRTAISPRLAINTLENMAFSSRYRSPKAKVISAVTIRLPSQVAVAFPPDGAPVLIISTSRRRVIPSSTGLRNRALSYAGKRGQLALVLRQGRGRKPPRPGPASQ